MAVRVKDAQLVRIKKELMQKQNGVCPLCKRDMTRMPPDNVVVDHDHTTGLIRAVLCRNCNGIEGKVKRLAIRCSNGKTYKNWIIRLANYYHQNREPQTNYIHPTHLTETEKRLKRNKKARAKYKRDKLAEIKAKAKAKGSK